MTAPPEPSSPRFNIELEFVLCLSNPQYLQYLAGTNPHLLNPPRNTEGQDSESARFARYLQYLHNYWKTPAYSKYLTHPGAVLRNLELLQQEQFRKDIIRPDVIAKLIDTENSVSKQSDITPTVIMHGAEEATRTTTDNLIA